jgi:2-polyprenyl-3-methyl-5-hydroxy-6-metoxy-1,4-benzoquinol methylase
METCNWDKIWSEKNNDVEFWHWVRRENDGVRGRRIISYIEKYLGGISGLKAIEIGSGAGVYSLILAQRGACVTLLDHSNEALMLAKKYFDALGLTASFVFDDALNLKTQLWEKFDVAASFGTVEHFAYPQRFSIAKAHLDLVKPGGIVIISVPNRYFLPDEVLKAYLQQKGKWFLGFAKSFTRVELIRIGKKLGLENLEVRGSAFICDLYRYLGIYFQNGFFKKIFPLAIKPGFIKDIRSPLDDFLGADIFLMGTRPK